MTSEFTRTRPAGSVARFAAVLAAPWVALVRPRAAGRMVVRAGLPSVVVGLTLMWALLSAEAILLLAWDETRSLRSLWSLAPTNERTVESVLVVRPLSEVLLSWNSSWDPSPLLLAPLFIGTWAVGCHLAGTLCLVPRTYRGERFGESIRTNLKLPWVCLGLVLVIVGLAGSALVIAEDEQDRVRARHWVATGSTLGFGSGWWDYLLAGTLLFGTASTWLVIAQAQGIAGGAVPKQPADATGPRCVGCGYSLEHVPAEGRCSECGESTDRSLSPQTRPGLPWQGRGGAVSFVRSAWSVFWRPAACYTQLLTRGHGACCWRFERYQFALLTAATVAGMVAFYLSHELPGPVEAWLILAMAGMGLWFAFCGWAGHRGMGGLAVMVAGLRGPGVDARALAGAVGYESVFLWTFLLLNFAAAFVDSHAGQHIEAFLIALGLTRSFVRLLLGSMFILGNLALALFWVRRYVIAYRALRWANY